MSAIQIRIRVDHFGLDPDAEGNAGLLYLFRKGFQSVFEFLRIGLPVAQARPVVVPLAKPAVIHDQHIKTRLGGFLGKFHQFVFINVEIAGFPGVQHHRMRLLNRFLGQNTVSGEIMKRAGHLPEAFVREGENGFGRGKFLARQQGVAEIFLA